MSIFSLDSPLMRVLGRVADLMILNIIFLICSLPIITIGATTTAMSYVVLRMRDGADGYVVRSFFHSFRQNFRQSTIIWLLALVVAFLLLADWAILRSGTGMMTSVMTVMVVIVLILYLMEMLFVFSVLARFDNTIWNTIKNAMIMAIADFPRFLLMVLIIAASAVVSVLTATLFMWAILFWTILGFACVAYWNGYFMNKILHKYMPEEEKDPDHWDVDETMGGSTEKEKIEGEASAEETPAEEIPSEEPATDSTKE